MPQYILKIKINADSTDAVEKAGYVLQNIADHVSEKEINDVYKKIKEKPSFFSQIVKKINNPLVNSFIK
jgi:hypothetical protein